MQRIAIIFLVDQSKFDCPNEKTAVQKRMPGSPGILFGFFIPFSAVLTVRGTQRARPPAPPAVGAFRSFCCQCCAAGVSGGSMRKVDWPKSTVFILKLKRFWS